MRLQERNNKWVLYDDAGKVLVITRDRAIALKIAREANERLSKMDKNGNGVIEPTEWEALEIWNRKKEIEDADKRRDSQRNMAWFSLLGLLLYPFAVLLASAIGLDQAAEIIGAMASIYFVSIAALVGAFFGFSSMENKSSAKKASVKMETES